MAENLRCPECDLTAALDGTRIVYGTRPCPVAGHPMVCHHMVKVVTAALKATSPQFVLRPPD